MTLGDRPRAATLRRGVETIFGKHSVRAVFLARPAAVRRLILAGRESYHQEFIALAREAGVEPELLSWGAFLRAAGLTEEDKHQGIAALVDPRPFLGQHDLGLLEDARVVLALDQISDPQNLGAMLRNAAFFGADAVLIMRNRSAELTPTVARIAVGGAEFVRIFRITNLAQSLDILKGYGFWVYGLDERGEQTLAEADFDAKAVLVIGAEGQGLRARTRTKCDVLVRIPGGRPGVESLNAGVASAVALAELLR